jgi:hypothetical protein
MHIIWDHVAMKNRSEMSKTGIHIQGFAKAHRIPNLNTKKYTPSANDEYVIKTDE